MHPFQGQASRGARMSFTDVRESHDTDSSSHRYRSGLLTKKSVRRLSLPDARAGAPSVRFLQPSETPHRNIARKENKKGSRLTPIIGERSSRTPFTESEELWAVTSILARFRSGWTRLRREWKGRHAVPESGLMMVSRSVSTAGHQ